MRTYQLIFIGVLAAGLPAQTPLTLSPSASPSAGEPGVTSINVTGSGFPTGQILPANTVVTLQTGSSSQVTTSATAVTTIAGSVRRVTFSIPSSISVSTPAAYLVSISGSTTAGTTFASSNQAPLTVNPAASASLSPGQGQQGAQTLSIAITGQYTNFVNGATQANFGAGISVGGSSAGGMGPVVVSSPTSATATLAIASGAALGARTVSVQTGIEIAQISNGFTVTAAPPSTTISGFSPASAPWGTLVTVTGTGLLASAGSVSQITLQKQSGGTIGAPVSNSAANSLSFVIPSGAATGPLQVTVNGVTVTSATPLIIVPASSFTLAASPNALTVIQGQTVASAVTLNGTNGFNQLVSLNITGLPAGVTASFNPPQITAGQTAVLSLNASSAQATSGAVLNLSAAATVSGIAVTQSAALSLSIVGASTSFVGRTVLPDTKETALAGVTVTMLGTDGNGNRTGCSGTAISDAAGNFALTGLAQSCVGRQLVAYEGTTATSPAGKYAGVNLVYTLTAGQVTASPVLVHLPRIDDKETFLVHQNASADQTYAYSSIPGLSLTVYKGTTFTLADGTTPDPFPLVAVQVPVDRLPDQKPFVPTMLQVFIVAFQPANAVASQPVAVSYPNVISTVPGTDMALMTLDPTRGQMVPYGTASVSNDGTEIVPDPDPNYPGHRFGIVHFDWHGPMPPPSPQVNPTPGGPSCGEPIDPSTGIEMFVSTDISISGLRGPVTLDRLYRTLSNNPGPFGIGTGHSYSYVLDASAYLQQGGPLYLDSPDGWAFPFAGQSNGTLTNSTQSFLIGAAISVPSSGVYDLRWKDGVIWEFRVVSAVGNLTAYLSSITDPNGNAITLTRNPAQPQEILQITDPVGRSLTFSYDSSARITSITDPLGRRLAYTYNTQGTLQTYLNAAGGTTTYTYDAENRLLTITDPRGVVTVQNTYDANGRVSSQTLANGGVWTYSYTLLNPTAAASSPVLVATSLDPMGHSTSYHFDPKGTLLDVTDSLGQTRVFARQPGTDLILSITGAGACPFCATGAGDLNFAYDLTGNMLSLTDSLNDKWSFTYDPVFNNTTSVKDPLGNITQYTYDSKGNLTELTLPSGANNSLTLDAQGDVTEVTDALDRATSFAYDSSGNLVSISDPLANKLSFSYDAVSHIVGATNPLNESVAISYDPLDRPVSRTDPSGGTIHASYDGVGNDTSLTDERNEVWVFSYDGLYNLVKAKDPLGEASVKTYDLAGNLVSFQDQRGQTAIYKYDSLNRLVQEQYQDGSTDIRSYDSNGRLVQIADSLSGVFQYSYDSAGRPTGTVSPNGGMAYTYDTAGRLVSQQAAGDPAVQYTYTANGFVQKVTNGLIGATFGYAVDDSVLRISRNSGVDTTYSYDMLQRALSITHTIGSSVLSSTTYNYDQANSQSSLTALTGHSDSTSTSSNKYDILNRLLQGGGEMFSYDSTGNLISISGPTGVTDFAWDARNRLRSIAEPNGQTTRFTYDFGRRMIAQSTSGPSGNLSQSYMWDLADNISHVARSNGDNLSVVAEALIDRYLAVLHANGQVEYGLTDLLGTTTITTDNAGRQVSTLTYDPFGQITAGSSSYPFQFMSKPPTAAGLNYMRARYYLPSAGRFVSEDPSMFASGSTNLYNFAGDDPINKVEFSGLDPAGPNEYLTIGTYFDDWHGHTTVAIGAGPYSGYYSVLGPVGPLMDETQNPLLTTRLPITPQQADDLRRLKRSARSGRLPPYSYQYNCTGYARDALRIANVPTNWSLGPLSAPYLTQLELISQGHLPTVDLLGLTQNGAFNNAVNAFNNAVNNVINTLPSPLIF